MRSSDLEVGVIGTTNCCYTETVRPKKKKKKKKKKSCFFSEVAFFFAIRKNVLASQNLFFFFFVYENVSLAHLPSSILPLFSLSNFILTHPSENSTVRFVEGFTVHTHFP